MMISITSGNPTEAQARPSEIFLGAFLPRLKKFPGVAAIYHFSKPENREETTIIIWESSEAMKAYRESELIKEALAFEIKTGILTRREAYPLLSAY